MRKRFGKNDLVFVGVLLVICIVVFLIFFVYKGDKSGWVVVTIDGEEYGRYLLTQDQTIEIKDNDGNVTNVLVIADGSADMTDADCPDQLCVSQRAISRAGENIVCLPNRVVATIERADEDALDGFAQ